MRPIPSARGFLAAVLVIGASSGAFGQAVYFQRGDSNSDGSVDMSDAVHSLAYLFSGGATPSCMDAVDSNDSGTVDLSDPVFTLGFLFAGGSPLPAPGMDCGYDPTRDDLACVAAAACFQPSTSFEVVDGLAVVEGDIIIGRPEDFLPDIFDFPPFDWDLPFDIGGAKKGGGASNMLCAGKRLLWPGGVVPYIFASSLSADTQGKINQAIADWQATTPIRFVVRTMEPNWIVFRQGSDDNCSSQVGILPDSADSGEQSIYIGKDCSTGNVRHEIGHCIGLFHEQSRDDRDAFVEVLWGNIIDGKADQFDSNETKSCDEGPYDYGSIMHYSLTNSFSKKDSKGNRLPTLRTKQTVPAGVTIGQRDALSDLDRTAVRRLYGANVPAGGQVAMEKQAWDLTTALSVGDDGSLQVSWVVGTNNWDGPVPISWPNFAPAGGAVAMAKQFDNVLTALTIGNDGAMYVSWVVDFGIWQGPVRISGTGIFPPGAPIAMAKQLPNVLTALCVAWNGALCVSWVVDAGVWQGPVAISGPGYAPPFTTVAMAKQFDDVLTALTVGWNGALHVSWVVGAGVWQGPVPISGTGFAPGGAGVAMAKQAPNLLTALTVGWNGALHVSWVVGAGVWQGPVPISAADFAPAGAKVAMAKQWDNLTTALVVGNNGALHVSWVLGTEAWQGPVPISGAGYAPPGAGVAMAKQMPDLLTAMTIGWNNKLNVSWVVGGGIWQGPASIR